MEIEEELKHLVVDTGSNVSILQPGVSRSDIIDTDVKPYGVSGGTLEIHGKQRVYFVLAGRKFSYNFQVCPISTKADGLLGTDLLDKAGARNKF